VSKLAAPIIAKRGGGGLVRLKGEWAAIVGAEWATVAWPSALGRDGALKLRTPATAALELQHRAPLLIERINRFFGRSLVTRLVLVQAPLLPDSPSRDRPAAVVVATQVTATLDARLSAIANPDLRAALAKLGHAVIGARF
jgi:hypothetical protein